MNQTAKVVTRGRSQAVCLPPGFRFDVPEVLSGMTPKQAM